MKRIIFYIIFSMLCSPVFAGLKTEDSITAKEISTPSNPSASYWKFYFKSDGKMYKLSPAGVESEITDISAERCIIFSIGDGVTALTAGQTRQSAQIPYGGTILAWKIADGNGLSSSIVVDIAKKASANPAFPTDSIAGTEKPTLSADNLNNDDSLSTWTTSFSAGDVFAVKVDSCGGNIKQAVVVLYVQKS